MNEQLQQGSVAWRIHHDLHFETRTALSHLIVCRQNGFSAVSKWKASQKRFMQSDAV
jgi:hypothetical protein